MKTINNVYRNVLTLRETYINIFEKGKVILCKIYISFRSKTEN